MSRISKLDREAAPEKAQELLSSYKTVPGMYQVMAHAPAAMEAYMNFGKGMVKSNIPRPLREQIAVLSAQENGCEYCLAAHVEGGKRAGLTEEQILLARQGKADDPKSAAALTFAQTVIRQRGQVSDAELAALHEAGFSQAETLDLIAVTVVNIFSNYINMIAKTEPDEPKVDLALPVLNR